MHWHPAILQDALSQDLLLGPPERELHESLCWLQLDSVCGQASGVADARANFTVQPWHLSAADCLSALQAVLLNCQHVVEFNTSI